MLERGSFEIVDIYVNHGSDSNQFNPIKSLGFKIVKNVAFLGQNF